MPPAGFALGLAYPSATFANPAGGIYASGINSGDVPCAPGKQVVGGGVRTSGFDQFVNESSPTDGTGSGWGATVENFGTSNESFTVTAICVSP